MNFWVRDPKTGETSVTLTLMLVAFTGAVVGGSLELAHMVDDASIFLNLFMTTAATYWGRKLSFGGKTYESVTNKESS